MKKIIILLFFLFSVSFYGQWVQQVSGVSENLNDVYCITENLVFVVGDYGKILKTTDGGDNWVQKTSGTTQILNRIQFANASVGYAVGNNGVLLKTIDGGENWTFVATGITSNLYGLSVLNENTFFVSGENGLIKKSIDGGISFTTLFEPSNLGVFDIQFFGQLIGYAEVGITNNFYQNNKLYKTVDGGISWLLLTMDPIDGFHFINENLGFVNFTSVGLSKTINGGTNLVSFNIQNNEAAEVYAFNENVIWNTKNQYDLCWCDSTQLV